MKKRVLTTAAFACAIALAGAVILMNQQPPAGGSGRTAAVEPAPESTYDVQPDATATSPKPDVTRPPASATPDTEPKTQPEKQPPQPGKRVSTEVLPVADAVRALPPSKPLPALLNSPPPPTASAVGKVVDGFPAKLIPAVPDSSVSNSSVTSEGPHLQAALEGKTLLSVNDVLVFYRAHFAPYGLLESSTPSAGEIGTTVFTRDDNAVTLTVTPVAGGSTYVLFGVFTVEG